MTTTLEISPPVDESELMRYAVATEQAFAPNPRATPDLSEFQQIGLANIRFARLAGRLAAGAAIIPMGQWFGGRSVPMGGIGAVVVLPEHRGSGVGTQLMRRVLQDVHEQGLALSALFPASQPIYRAAGYEQAGITMRYRLPAGALASHRDRILSIREGADGEEEELRRLYTECARRTAGNLDRPSIMWEWRLKGEQPVSRYIVERDGASEGYITYQLRGKSDVWERDLVVRDLVALTPDAARTLLTFLAGHRSVITNVTWNGSPADPLLLHLREQGYKIGHYEQWMLRLVDVPAALTARDYPSAVAAEVELAVRDSVLPWNDGRFVLTVADGRAEVRPGGDGRIGVDIRGLAPLYSGYLSPLALRDAGLLEGSEADLATLAAIFAGPVPWMPDHF